MEGGGADDTADVTATGGLSSSCVMWLVFKLDELTSVDKLLKGSVLVGTSVSLVVIEEVVEPAKEQTQ